MQKKRWMCRTEWHSNSVWCTSFLIHVISTHHLISCVGRLNHFLIRVVVACYQCFRRIQSILWVDSITSVDWFNHLQASPSILMIWFSLLRQLIWSPVTSFSQIYGLASNIIESFDLSVKRNWAETIRVWLMLTCVSKHHDNWGINEIP